MFDEEYKKFEIILTTYVALNEENGKWDVHHVLQQKRSKGIDEEWEEREAVVDISEDNLDYAMGKAYSAMASFLDSIGGSFFAELPKPEETGEIVQ